MSWNCVWHRWTTSFGHRAHTIQGQIVNGCNICGCLHSQQLPVVIAARHTCECILKSHYEMFKKYSAPAGLNIKRQLCWMSHLPSGTVASSNSFSPQGVLHLRKTEDMLWVQGCHWTTPCNYTESSIHFWRRGEEDMACHTNCLKHVIKERKKATGGPPYGRGNWLRDGGQSLEL